MIYLDNAATTFPKPEAVYTAMDEVNRKLSVNAGRGSYKAAREANELISDTKDRLLGMFDAKGIADVVLTPSITHALGQIINGLDLSRDSIVYISPYEHNAVARTIEKRRKETGFKLEFLPLDDDLHIDIERTEFMFADKKPDAVICIAVSNVTGYILPFNEIFRMAKKYSAVTVLDAAQAAGLISLDMERTDILAFAGHKTLYGPFGIGGFVIKKGVSLNVVLTGGTGSDSLNTDMPLNSPNKYEAGSPNIVAIAGLQASLIELDIREHERHLRELTRKLIEELSYCSNVSLCGPYDENHIGIVSFVINGYSSDDVGKILDEEFDIAVRTGNHCAPYIHQYLKDGEYNGTVRVGLGMYSTEEDIEKLIGAIETL